VRFVSTWQSQYQSRKPALDTVWGGQNFFEDRMMHTYRRGNNA